MATPIYSGLTNDESYGRRGGAMDVRALMERAVRFWGDHEAVVSGVHRLTFSEAWDRGVRLANGLLDMELRPGDRVGVLEDNDLGAADFFLACTIANLVRVPLYPRNARDSHLDMIAHTGCRAVVVSEKFAPEMDGLINDIPSLENIFVRDSTYEKFVQSQSDVDPRPAVNEDDYYIIRHTAGTTGKSKGVAYTHRTWLATARNWFYAYPPVEIGDACLHLGPISHGSGYFFVPIWISGGRNVLVPSFQPASAIALMEQEPISYMFAVPTIVNALAREETASQRDWSRLKVISVGGSPITEATARRARDVFGDVLYQIYGQTEVLPATNISPKEWFSEIPGSEPLKSAGRPFPFVEIEVLDQVTREVLPVGEAGEIAVRSDGQMLGFWEDQEASKERIIDGWILTGDIGRFDRNGYLYILDRANDMIISGGFNIYPAELENVIAQLERVVEVAVFAIPSAQWGESPAARVVVEDLSQITEQQVMDQCIEKLGSYKKPAHVEITTEPLPKSPVGKVLRKVLRDPYWEGHDRRVAGG